VVLSCCCDEGEERRGERERGNRRKLKQEHGNRECAEEHRADGENPPSGPRTGATPEPRIGGDAG